MEKTKITLNQILNLICVLSIAIILICYFAVFWNYSGKIASLHDLVGFPSDNTELTDYLQKELNTPFDLNAFVIAPIVILLGGLSGGIICTIKIKSTNNYIFNTLYGAFGIIFLSISKEMKLGGSWAFLLVLFSLITLCGIIEILLKFVIKKEIGFLLNENILHKLTVSLFAVATFILCIIITITNLNYKKEVITNSELIAKYEKKDLISLRELKLQVDTDKIDNDGILKIDSIISEINNGKLKIENEKAVIELLEKIKNGETGNKNKENIDKLFEELEKLQNNTPSEPADESPKEEPKQPSTEP